MSTILADCLNVREEPSTNSKKISKYYKDQKILTGDLLIMNDNRLWLRYTGRSGYKRYVCVLDEDGSLYVDFEKNIPLCIDNDTYNDDEDYGTGITGIPLQKDFPNEIIRKSGCCFLCTCVKGGLTTLEQCMDCFDWGIKSGKLEYDCYVSYNKEQWAKEIAQKYGTQYHEDYCFQNNNRHFWLTQNGNEIFNSAGIGWRG